MDFESVPGANTPVISPQQTQCAFFDCLQLESQPRLGQSSSRNIEQQSHCSKFIQPKSQNQRDHVSEWLDKVQVDSQLECENVDGSTERPWWIWCVGTMDIFSGIWNTVLVTENILEGPGNDPDLYFLQLFSTFLGILARVLMGIGLLIGLKHRDVSVTLWYCKLWTVCQITFVIVSFIHLIAIILISYGELSSNPKEEETDPSILKIITILILRIISFILVRKFVGIIKISGNPDAMSSLGDHTCCPEEAQPHQLENRKRDNEGFGESCICGPSVALLMSL